jgi:hypothetical protein
VWVVTGAPIYQGYAAVTEFVRFVDRMLGAHPERHAGDQSKMFLWRNHGSHQSGKSPSMFRLTAPASTGSNSVPT